MSTVFSIDLPLSLGPMDEFGLIQAYFAGSSAAQQGNGLDHKQSLGIGDDAALLAPIPQGQQLVVTTDSLVENRHYLSDVDPTALGHKALAVSLSDLAAMGAKPWAFTLNLHLRCIRKPWLEAFSKGLNALALEHGISLVGGDTVSVQAEEAVVVTAMGLVPLGQALLREVLQPGDELWVSGSLGDGMYALKHKPYANKLLWPQPRLALGQALRNQQLAHAAIDISDGLASELGHLLERSQARSQGLELTAHVYLQSLSQCLGPELKAAVSRNDLDLQQACLLAVRSGDEYELLFAAPLAARPAILALALQLNLRLTPIGRVDLRQACPAGQPASTDMGQNRWYGLEGQVLSLSQDALAGFNHFQPAGDQET